MTELNWVDPFYVWTGFAVCAWGIQFIWYAINWYISPRKYLGD